MDSVIRGANWYVDTLNMYLRLTEIQLPQLDRETDAVNLSAHFMEFELPGIWKAMSCPFSLKGAHEQVRGLFGRDPGDWTSFFYYEHLRDLRDGRNRGRVVQLTGLIGMVDQPSVKGMKADDTKYQVKSVVKYHDIVDGRTVHKADFLSGQSPIINGVRYQSQRDQILRVQGGQG